MSHTTEAGANPPDEPAQNGARDGERAGESATPAPGSAAGSNHNPLRGSYAGSSHGGAAAKPPRKEEDPDEVLEYTQLAVASLDELRAAMGWAFEGEEEISPGLLDRYAEHARMVLEGNAVMNLTAIVDPREMAAKHYLDSWRTTRLLPLAGRSLCDMGTGAGYPGVPVALAEPQAKVGLVDSTRKRIDFVQSCIERLGLQNAKAYAERAEDHLARNKYDIVLVRAVSSVRENVRILRKVRHSHKDLVMLKGPSWSREARAAEREAERLGFRLDTVWEHKLPGELGERAFLVYRAPGGHGN
jgi:16S rRNA (guanine527-N7)-methyltransferase